ncbi:Mechanosensitive ion channel-domain-containing protein [Epithele typhae]|uniref:Mechanosensitive ion channel-domain-containing protein n=1 Tax=Epithele typhae TaxID=378194 RepID=UPI002007EE48|nr:Mechanosensitive ion channel-domain-containing protein [Epithele typhae]KAH9940505.1 Mechanosensitive ion channel-domain-containing protein [Epithele typhae]
MDGGAGRNASWDLLAGVRKFEQGYERFDTRNASEAHLQFADGDVPKNGLSRLYQYLLNVSIVTRWAIFIVPVLGILWIPGILGLTKFPDTKFEGVRLVYWSIWLSVMWAGWWVALAASMFLPHFLRHTAGVIVVGTRKYIEWLSVLHRYAAFFGWSLAIWVAFQPLINARQETDSTSQQKFIDTVSKLLFALMLSAALLFGEKLSIQWIAGKFHERSYAERIADQKFAVRSLVTLYAHSTDIPWRADTLKDGDNADRSANGKRKTLNPQRLFKKALKGVRGVATTTTTVLGNVASEIAGTSVLQPDSPQAKVKTALESANKSRLLARRLFYSFARPGSDKMFVEDILRFFATYDEAEQAYSIFDKDMNGDVSRDEIEMACMEIHREQLSIEHSMRDLDSAVGRLDNILMSLYAIAVALIFAVSLEASVATLLSSAGTLVLGLSWLIGGSLAEVLTSIIFLFIKHPYDVGDRVEIDKITYTVKEIRLLSTIFLDINGCLVQAPNTVLNAQPIHNMRRSPQMSEPFEFDVSYGTTFEQIERLRAVMLSFVKAERRDYLPIFDVYVIDMPAQEKLTLKADIKYKSNWQQGTLRAQRRNKWICALKASLEKLHIYGPAGPPSGAPAPIKYTQVPYSDVLKQEEEERHSRKPTSGSDELHIPKSDWTFSDPNSSAVDNSQDVFDEGSQLYRPTQTPDGSVRGQPPMAMPSAVTMPAMPMQGMPSSSERGPVMEEIELRTPRADQLTHNI